MGARDSSASSSRHSVSSDCLESRPSKTAFDAWMASPRSGPTCSATWSRSRRGPMWPSTSPRSRGGSSTWASVPERCGSSPPAKQRRRLTGNPGIAFGAGRSRCHSKAACPTLGLAHRNSRCSSTATSPHCGRDRCRSTAGSRDKPGHDRSQASLDALAADEARAVQRERVCAGPGGCVRTRARQRHRRLDRAADSAHGPGQQARTSRRAAQLLLPALWLTRATPSGIGKCIGTLKNSGLTVRRESAMTDERTPGILRANDVRKPAPPRSSIQTLRLRVGSSAIQYSGTTPSTWVSISLLAFHPLHHTAARRLHAPRPDNAPLLLSCHPPSIDAILRWPRP